MAKFRKKPVVIDATQWFKDGDHPAVESRAPEIVFDEADNYFYVTRYDSDIDRPEAWVAVDPEGKIAATYGDVLPFAFYSLRAGKRTPITAFPELATEYAKRSSWTTAPIAMGYVRTLEGGHMVTPGDWIITGVKGEFYPCKPDIFAETYEAAE